MVMEIKKKLLNLDYESELKKHVDGLPKNAKKYISNFIDTGN